MGLQNGEVFVLAGRPGNGKSALAMNIADHASVMLGLPVAVFSLEMSTKSLGVRLMCSRAKVNIRNIQDGFMAERDWPKLTIAAGHLHHAPMRIDSECGVSIAELRAKARILHRLYAIKLLVIDYLQLLLPSGRPNGSRQNDVSEMSAAIKRLAMDLNIPILLLSQLNRSVEKEKGRKPRLSDLRESGSIEQDADTVGLLYRADPYNPANALRGDEDADEPNDLDAIPVNLDIAKQRNGPTGTVHLIFCRCWTRFESCSKITDTPEPPTETQENLPIP